MINNKNKENITIVLSVVVTILTVINQGGYFPGAIVLAGFIVAIIFLRKRVKVSILEITGLLFGLWYMFCSVRYGFIWENAVKGIMPLTALMFWSILPEKKEGREDILCKIMKVSVYIAVLSVILCIISSVKAGNLQRLIFPFQYANASGIFFGVLFILSRYSKEENIRKKQYIFFVTLLLTQSVGAIGLTVLAELFLSKNKKKSFIIAGIIALFAVLFRGRIYQSAGTFAERLLHIHDGVLCMADNPVFGIGVGNWGILKGIYQTGFYDVAEIHSSIISVGVNSGIVGLILFLLLIVMFFVSTKFSNKSHMVCVLMLLIHSCFDFTLSFFGAVMMLMIIAGLGEKKDEKRIEVNIILKNTVCGILFLTFLFFTAGLAKIGNFQKLRDIKIISDKYETDWMLKYSANAEKMYLEALFASGECDKLVDLIESVKQPYDARAIILKSRCLDDWNIVLEELKKQPYNEQFYEACEMCDDDEVSRETENIYNNAVNSMSWIGKFLFDFMGEKI